VGVTGHRTLAHAGEVARQVDAVLDRLLDGGAVPVAVSSLAEGADRLLAERVLARPEGRLEVLLPLEVDDYALDFDGPGSVAAFNDLVAAADEVRVIPRPPDDDGTREAAYERAGRAVLERCEVLVALWDREPSRGRGGTAELVADARERGIPVEVVEVVR
jgi:hypothetical protein